MNEKLEALAKQVSEETLEEVVQFLELRIARDGGNPAAPKEEALVAQDEIPDDVPNWLWDGRVPLGSLTALFGNRGTGKSAVVLDMAARVSAGKAWPDAPELTQIPGSVLIVSMEGEPHRAIFPRLRAFGADLKKIFCVRTTDPTTHARRTFRARDIDAWDKIAAETPDLRLVVIDAFALFIGLGFDRRTGDVARLLARLDQFARRHNVAVVLVNAGDKDSAGKTWRHGENVRPAIESWARSVWAIEDDFLESGQRFFLPARLGLGANPGGLVFTIDPRTGSVAWSEEPVPMNADTGRPTARQSSAVAEAMRWLRTFLGGGPRLAESVLAAGAQHGHSRRALYAAKDKLGIRSDKDSTSFAGTWTWNFPRAPQRTTPIARAPETTEERATTPRPEDSKIPASAPASPAPAPFRPVVRRASEIEAASIPQNGSSEIPAARCEDAKIPTARTRVIGQPSVNTLRAVLREVATVPVVHGANLASALAPAPPANRRARRRKR